MNAAGLTSAAQRLGGTASGWHSVWVAQRLAGRAFAWALAVSVSSGTLLPSRAACETLFGNMSRVLVVDDEESLRIVLTTLLEAHGYTTLAASSGEEALEVIADFNPEFLFADLRMPGMSGIGLCQRLRAIHHPATVIVISAYGSVDLALEAIKAGAYDYIAKPFKQDEVLLVLRKAEEREALRRENRELRRVLKDQSVSGTMIGQSAAMKQLLRMVDKVASYQTTVLIAGESGTGKELVARMLHDESPRAQKPFIPVNCGAIPDKLLESELFGVRRGAFTDATADKPGLFEEANHGTLFLDEVGELPLALQVKLLRALQEGRVRRVGDTKDRAVDVRIVAATVRELEKDVKEGRFREDLFYRLNVLQIRTPPLRERKEDIPLLCRHFITKINARLETTCAGISREAQRLLLDYDWPGNVRELENLVERAMVLTEHEKLVADDLPERVRNFIASKKVFSGSTGLSIKKATREIEELFIRKALAQTGGNRTAAAKLLEISQRALIYKIKDYEVE